MSLQTKQISICFLARSHTIELKDHIIVQFEETEKVHDDSVPNLAAQKPLKNLREAGKDFAVPTLQTSIGSFRKLIKKSFNSNT
jgi:hypothetical protein